MMKGLATNHQDYYEPLVVDENMSNLTCVSGGEASGSSINKNEHSGMYPPQHFPVARTNQSQPQPQPMKKKRNQPGNPDPDAEVITLSPTTLMATNRFVCDICNKGFQRDQNLQLHRRGHNLPWKLKQRTSKEMRKKVYVCPEPSCIHHDPSRALGDLTGIKKHFFRKHGEKKWKCERCSKKYAVLSDWKAHSKTCGTKEYRCDCGTLFSRKDSFMTHRAFCEILAEEKARNNISNILSNQPGSSLTNLQIPMHFNADINHPFPIKKEHQSFSLAQETMPPWLVTSCPQILVPSQGTPPLDPTLYHPRLDQDFTQHYDHQIQNPNTNLQNYHQPNSPHISATALLQQASQMGAKTSSFTFPSQSAMFTKPHQAAHVSCVDPVQNTVSGFGPTREDAATLFINSLASKAAAAAASETCTEKDHASVGCTLTGPQAGSMMMMMNTSQCTSGFEGSTFEDAFKEIMMGASSKKDGHASHDDDKFSKSKGKESDGMTRDFLGLRPLSHSEMLSITGLGDSMNNHKK